MQRTRLTPAIELYQKYTEGTYDPLSDFREDLAFNLKNGADILIEETGIHNDNPFVNKPADIVHWSKEHVDDCNQMLSDYNEYVVNTIEDLKYSAKLRYELYTPIDGHDRESIDAEYAQLTQDEKAKRIIERCQRRLNYIRKNGTDDVLEVDIRRQNIFNIRFAQSNYDVNHPLSMLYIDKFALTNNVTVLQSVYENGTDKAPYQHQLREYTIGEILEIAANKNVNKVDKTVRPVVLPLTGGDRIVGEKAYLNWSGLQVFDVDLKFSKEFWDKGITASEVRDMLFDKLSHYPWLISVNVSASKRGVHVWTKVSRMHHLYKEDEANIEHGKYWYRMSYLQKWAALAYVLKNVCGVDDVYSNNKVLDTAMAQPRQVAAVNYDPETRYNPNFIDLYPVIFYHKTPVPNITDEDWLLNDTVYNAFGNWFTENEISNLTAQGIEVKRAASISVNLDESYLLKDIKQINIQALPQGDRYKTRYRVVNTIIDLYGDTKESRELIYHILQANETSTKSQITAYIRSAATNKKQADVYMIRYLHKLGLNIELTEETKAEVREVELTKAEFVIKNSNYIFKNSQPDYVIQLEEGEYLGAKQDRILSIFNEYKLNLIESPPNTGKTTLFKYLARQYSVCMVSPFTSTIESKIITDDEIKDLFDVYYGDRNVKEIHENPGRSAVMTFDKFSRLQKSDYELFDYIVVDESHLLFTSTYRLEVVSQTVENIREYLLNDAKSVQDAFGGLRSSFQNLLEPVNISQKRYTTFIMMSGTITCEADYFTFYDLLNYIKIRKKHPFEKNVEFVFSQTKESKNIAMYEDIANAIREGRKVLHPTNNGDGYAKKVVAAVEYILERKITWEYYKRANKDETFLQEINADCTTKGIELLFSTDYLSVGIDIEDVDKYKIVYSNDFTGEEIEQFNNRLRRTNIECSIFCDILTDDGFVKPNALSTKQIRYGANKELLQIFNDEQIISKLQRHIHDKQGYYAVIGELFSRYFVLNQYGQVRFVRAALEIEQFEKQFSEIARGLLYIKTALTKKYGYTASFRTQSEYSSEVINTFEQLLKATYEEHRQQKSDRYVELVNFVTEDINYSIFQNAEKIEHVRHDILFAEDEYPLHLGYDSTNSNGTAVFNYNKDYKYLLEPAIKYALRIRKYYDSDTSKNIIQDCISNGLVSYTELDRYMRLIRLLNDDRNRFLTVSTKDMLSIAYEHIPTDASKVHKIDRIDYDAMIIRMREQIHDQIEKLTGNTLKSEKRIDEVNRRVGTFVDILFRKRISKNTVSIQFRKVYEFNSERMLNRIKNDDIFRQVLLNESETIALENKRTEALNEGHIQTTTDVMMY